MGWFLRHYADFGGRARRGEFWKFVLLSTVFALAWTLLATLAFAAMGADRSRLAYIAALSWLSFHVAVFVPGTALVVRRLHDLGKSAWCLLWSVSPFLLYRPVVAAVYALYEAEKIDDFAKTTGVFMAYLISSLGLLWLLGLMFKTGEAKENQYGPFPQSAATTFSATFSEQAKLKSAGFCLLVAFASFLGADFLSIKPGDSSTVDRILSYIPELMLLVAGVFLWRAKPGRPEEEPKGQGRTALVWLLLANVLFVVLAVRSALYTWWGPEHEAWWFGQEPRMARMFHFEVHIGHRLWVVFFAAALLFCFQNKKWVARASVGLILSSALTLLWMVYSHPLLSQLLKEGYRRQYDLLQLLSIPSVLSMFYMLLAMACVVMASAFFPRKQAL